VYNLFHDTFSEYVTEDQFIHNIFGDGDGDWKYSTIKNRILENTDPDAIVSTLLCNAAHTYFQIHNFTTNLDKIMLNKYDVFDSQPKKRDIALNHLLNVKTTADMTAWINTRKSQVVSKRIARNSEVSTLEGFFS
jgi:hypothetical protein